MRYPRLICCDISGYGNRGDYRDMKAYDLLVQCESGITSITTPGTEWTDEILVIILNVGVITTMTYHGIEKGRDTDEH